MSELIGCIFLNADRQLIQVYPSDPAFREALVEYQTQRVRELELSSHTDLIRCDNAIKSVETGPLFEWAKAGHSYNHVKLFLGPEGSGKSQCADQLAKGKQTFRLCLKGLGLSQVKRLFRKLTIPASTELLIGENALPEELSEILTEVMTQTGRLFTPGLPNIILTSTCERDDCQLDPALHRRTVLYDFPRTSGDRAG